MASLGAGAFTQQQIRQSANKALKSADNSVTKEIKEELARVGKGVDNVGLVLKNLLKNNEFKAIYDDFANGTLVRKFANELTLEEGAILRFYTNKSYWFGGVCDGLSYFGSRKSH